MNSSKEKFRTRLTTIVFLALTGGGIAVWAHIRESHQHNHGHAAPAAGSALTLNDGQRWKTDDSLRTGMERIRNAAAPVLAAPAPVTQEQTKALATSVQDAVGYMIKNCKLDPKADAALHVLITDLMSGAGMLAQDPASKDGAKLVAHALHQYPEYFEHPGWKMTLVATNEDHPPTGPN